MTETKQQSNTSEFQEDYSLGMKALVRSLQLSFIALAIIIIGMLIWYITGEGYYTVVPQEKAIVLRFGKVVRVCNDAGWYWDFPYPISKVIKVPISEQAISVRFAPLESESGFEDDEPRGGPLVPGKDDYLITGDTNILFTEFVVNYSIIDVKKYYLNYYTPEDPRNIDNNIDERGTRGPQTTLRSVMQSSVIKVTSGEKIDTPLFKSNTYKENVEREFRNNVRKLDIGVNINSIQLKKSTVPVEAKRAFQDVNRANQDSKKVKDEAREYSFTKENEALIAQSKIIAEAYAYKKRVVSDIEAEKMYFESILVEYKDNPETVLLSLYNKTLADVIANVKEKYIITTSDGKQELRIKINPEPIIEKQNGSQ
jgi:modulator of FtsH protease HflK